jgi:hypothetical protein
MTFPKIEDTLKALTQKTYRGFAPEGAELPYIVWDDDNNQSNLYGGGKMVLQVIEGTIDLYTKDQDDPLFDQIQQGINAVGVSFKFNSKQTEVGTEIIHYEWVWAVTRMVG